MNNPTTTHVRSFGMYTSAGDAAVAPLVDRSIDAVAHGASMILVLDRLAADLSALEAIFPGATDTVVRDTTIQIVIDAAEAYAKGLLVKPTKLVAVWGCIGAAHVETFHSYPEDGKCSCGVVKHHVHCTCGGITQVG